MMRILAAGAILAAAGTSAIAQNQIIDATNPQAIFEAARGFGSAELEKDSDGDPKITGRMDGVRYSVYFYGCKNNQQCKTIQFSASWSAPGKVSVERINQWNRDKRFGKAYLDKDNDPVIQHDVNLFGGVTRKNLDDTFDWWKTIVVDFAKVIP